MASASRRLRSVVVLCPPPLQSLNPVHVDRRTSRGVVAANLCRRRPYVKVTVAQSVFEGNSALGPETAVNAKWIPMAFGVPIEGLPVIDTALSGGGGALSLLKTQQGHSTNDPGSTGVHQPTWLNTAKCDIADTNITQNAADSDGGGLAIQNFDVTLTKVTVERNKAGAAGGGVYVSPRPRFWPQPRSLRTPTGVLPLVRARSARSPASCALTTMPTHRGDTLSQVHCERHCGTLGHRRRGAR